MFAPQQTSPPLTIAHECRSPVPMAVTPFESPDTGTGTSFCTWVLSPSWPSLFDPQHQAPPFTMAHVCEPLVEIALTPLPNPLTATGTVLCATLLLPSWPLAL